MELYEMWAIGCEELETYREEVDETEMVEFEQKGVKNDYY